MKVLGVTGNSGGGKSTVCKILARAGAYIINADAVARQVVEPGEPAYAELIDEFGAGILLENGAIDRKKLAGVVFADEDKRRRLIEITHKHIIRHTKEDMARVMENPGSHTFIVLDAPLLVEASLHLECDQVWLVTAGRGLMRQRIMARDGLTNQQADARLAAQPPFEALEPYADAVITNDGDMARLERDVNELAGRLLRGSSVDEL